MAAIQIATIATAALRLAGRPLAGSADARCSAMMWAGIMRTTSMMPSDTMMMSSK
jgi:hypothetical protein